MVSSSELAINTIYLMGASFVIGSMFTLSILLVLEFVRRDRDSGGRNGGGQ